MSPSSPSPAEKLTPVVKAKKLKKHRNIILRSYLEKKTTVLAENDDSAVKPIVSGESVSKVMVESVVDEDANSDTFVLNGNLSFLGLGDSFTSSEIEVESQESYLVDDGQASLVNDSQTSDDLQVSVEELTDLSASSSSSKRSSNSKKSSGRSSSRSKSPKTYHGTSRRKRMVPMSPLLLQNPALGRRSPLGNVYVPKIVDSTFTLKKRDFPPLSR